MGVLGNDPLAVDAMLRQSVALIPVKVRRCGQYENLAVHSSQRWERKRMHTAPRFHYKVYLSWRHGFAHGSHHRGGSTGMYMGSRPGWMASRFGRAHGRDIEATLGGKTSNSGALSQRSHELAKGRASHM